MKQKIRNKSLNFQIIIFLVFVYIFLSISLLLVTNIIKTNYKRSGEKNFEQITKEINNPTYNDLLDYYHSGYYIIDLGDSTNSMFTTIKINDNYYKLIAISNIEINDFITYTTDEDYIYLSQTGETGTVEEITYPKSINFLTTNNHYLQLVLEADKNSKAIIDGQQTIFFTYIDNYLIIQPVNSADKLFTTINLFQAVILLIVLIVVVICGYIANYYFVYPVVEITEICENFLEQKYSHNTLDYPNKTFTKLGKKITKVGDVLQEAYQELNRKKIEVENYIKRSEEDYQFNKQLVANISHEIKTPLAIIQATICAIQDGIFDENEAEEELNNVLLEIDKTNKMLHEIVGLYKMESTSFKLDLTTINLDELLQQKLQEFEKIALKYEQTLTYNGVENLNVVADKTQLDRIINNIILNAITYSPPQNRVTIETRKTNKYSVLEIINYGINIDNDDLENIFEPFYRVDKSRKKTEDHGNGLGLYYVKQMLDKHNLDFGMENVINGVRFYIIFDL